MKPFKQFVKKPNIKPKVGGVYKLIPLKDGQINTQLEDVEHRVVDAKQPIIVRVINVELLAGGADTENGPSEDDMYSVYMIECKILVGIGNIMWLDDPVNDSWKQWNHPELHIMWDGTNESNRFEPLTPDEHTAMLF